MEYDVIVIGAGASGLIAAIAAARQGSSVLVIEQKDKAGKKILATGNGKCNFTNLNQSPDCYRSNDSAFARKVLSCFDVNRTLQFFEDLGIYPKNRDGYLYPNSEQASSIVSVLMMECERLKVQFIYQEKVKSIIKPYYTVTTENNKQYRSKKLILATGGCASPKLGSDGSGYTIAKNLGHSIIKPLPALVQLKSPDKYCKTVSGVRTNAMVSLFAENKKVVDQDGEILFTDYGISGIPIMQISRFAAKALDQGKQVHLLIDFFTNQKEDELIGFIKKRLKQHPQKTLEEMLVGLFNHKLSYLLIMEAKLDTYKKSKLVTDQEVTKLVKNIKEFKMRISDTNSFDQAQVSAGGVSTLEIDHNTMESKLRKGLYLIGELVDVDGTCGGYNLQWAWSSGYIAGRSAAGK